MLLFSEAELNYLLVASYGLLYLGTLLYKNCFLQASWRRVYEVCMILNGVLSSFQLLLIGGHTFGLKPFLFALGDDAFAEFVKGVQFLVSFSFQDVNVVGIWPVCCASLRNLFLIVLTTATTKASFDNDDGAVPERYRRDFVRLVYDLPQLHSSACSHYKYYNA